MKNKALIRFIFERLPIPAQKTEFTSSGGLKRYYPDGVMVESFGLTFHQVTSLMRDGYITINRANFVEKSITLSLIGGVCLVVDGHDNIIVDTTILKCMPRTGESKKGVKVKTGEEFTLEFWEFSLESLGEEDRQAFLQDQFMMNSEIASVTSKGYDQCIAKSCFERNEATILSVLGALLVALLIFILNLSYLNNKIAGILQSHIEEYHTQERNSSSIGDKNETASQQKTGYTESKKDNTSIILPESSNEGDHIFNWLDRKSDPSSHQRMQLDEFTNPLLQDVM